MIVSQDHSIWSEYGPQDVVLDEETIGTRYALLPLRTFFDPNDEKDVKAAHALNPSTRGVTYSDATSEADIEPRPSAVRWSYEDGRRALESSTRALSSRVISVVISSFVRRRRSRVWLLPPAGCGSRAHT